MKLRRIAGSGGGVFLYTVDIEDDANGVGMILRGADRGEEVSVDLDIFVRDFGGQARGMKIEENTVRVCQAAGGVLHATFEIDGDACGVVGCRGADAAQAGNCGRSRGAYGLKRVVRFVERQRAFHDSRTRAGLHRRKARALF